MHESSLITDLIRKIETAAEVERVKKVASVRMKVGALVPLSVAHFQEHFARASQGRATEGARLHIEVSSDFSSPEAQEILLESIEVIEE